MFQNREEAGRLLAEKLRQYKSDLHTIILAIPRGGVVVGKAIANTLELPMSILVVKKLGAPNNPELAIGALAPNGVKVIDWELALKSGVEQEYLDEEIERKSREIEERLKKLSVVSCQLSVEEKKTIIITDDGVATGATVLAAIKYIKSIKPTTHNLQLTTILAVPVIAKDTYDKLKSEVDPDLIGVDRIVALEIAESFGAVGEFYREFPQVTDEEVIKML